MHNRLSRKRKGCLRYLKSNGKEIHWDFIEAAFASVSGIAIVPLQDILGLGSKARMNLPMKARKETGYGATRKAH